MFIWPCSPVCVCVCVRFSWLWFVPCLCFYKPHDSVPAPGATLTFSLPVQVLEKISCCAVYWGTPLPSPEVESSPQHSKRSLYAVFIGRPLSLDGAVRVKYSISLSLSFLFRTCPDFLRNFFCSLRRCRYSLQCYTYRDCDESTDIIYLRSSVWWAVQVWDGLRQGSLQWGHQL